MSEGSDVLGVQVSALTLEPWMRPLFVAKVRRALALIGRLEPWRLARIRRDIGTIGGLRGGNSYYEHLERLIGLSWTSVLPVGVEHVAMTIIHEATHARIRQAGIDYDEAIRERIETACVRQEAAFASRLPDGEALAKRALARLEHRWWTPEQMHLSQLRKARAHGLPAWFIRWLEWRHRRRQQRGRRGEEVAAR